MSLWGSANTTNETEPKFLANTATPYPGHIHDRYGHVYADNSGWWIKHPSKNGAKRELLVAINRLANKLGPALINDVFFSNVTSLDANTAWVANVAYNQEVLVLSATPPTLNIAVTGSISTNVVATFARGNGNNLLEFTFTTPRDFAGNTTSSATLTINDQPMAAAQGIIVRKTAATVNANTLIPTTANTLYPFTSVARTLSVIHPTVTVTNVIFAGGNTIARNAASNLFVTFSAPVNVLTAALPNVVLNVVSGNTTNATFASGNGTANLRFTWTGPQFVANVVSVANSRTILVGVINDLMNAAVNTYITAANATFSGTVTPT